ncbi:hypothetical protein [Kitasatospora sp. NPDC001175]|uniref:hypothetical protein n=1 Tax=Kitasatospora sp. NPDC001175 TaxID=3157103 RepID=UPI003D026622
MSEFLLLRRVPGQGDALHGTFAEHKAAGFALVVDDGADPDRLDGGHGDRAPAHRACDPWEFHADHSAGSF